MLIFHCSINRSDVNFTKDRASYCKTIELNDSMLRSICFQSTYGARSNCTIEIARSNCTIEIIVAIVFFIRFFSNCTIDIIVTIVFFIRFFDCTNLFFLFSYFFFNESVFSTDSLLSSITFPLITFRLFLLITFVNYFCELLFINYYL